MLWGNAFNQVPQYTLAAITVAAVLSSHPLYAYTFPVTRLIVRAPRGCGNNPRARRRRQAVQIASLSYTILKRTCDVGF